MPRKNPTPDPLLAIRIQQETEKLLLLRMKREDEERCRARRRPDGFDQISAALTAATETSPRTSPWG